MLSNYLQETESGEKLEKLLPLIHTTLLSNAKVIVAEGSLSSKKECPVFGGFLNYFFYAKPEYRDRNVGDSKYPPLDNLYVSFVFHAHSITPYKIFPFDTGAWKGGLYKRYCNFDHEFDAIDKQSRFEFNNDITYLPKYVSAFWENNNNYLNERFIQSIPDSVPACVKELYELIKCKNNEVDNRMRTPEVISRNTIDLTDDNQKPFAIVMHKSCLFTFEDGMPEFINKLIDLNIAYRDYTYGYGSALPPEPPNNFIPSIKQVIIEEILPKLLS